jgi:hypothetical protein
LQYRVRLGLGPLWLVWKGVLMGIDTKTFEQILSTTGDYRGTDCLILGDCTFHVGDMTLDGFKEICGFRSISTIDLFGSPTIKADLQAPPNPELLGKFDLIIDAGTLFCCFDVAGIWRNLLNMLTPKGMIFHQAALSGYFGRGYYCFQPALFRDFYRANGFLIQYMAVRSNRAEFDDYVEIDPDAVFSISSDGTSLKFGKKFDRHISVMPADMTIVCSARRTNVQSFKNATPPYYADT